MTSTNTACDPATRVTRSLLGYGVIAGPIYVVVSLAQALTREGFDLTRHAWSLLANGGPGWIHIANLVLTGLMVVAASIGLHRAGAGVWAPRLLAVYGLSMVAAGIFRADPAQGFPVGASEEITTHGVLHFVSGGVGFTCFAIACFVLARRFAAGGLAGWAAFSRATGALFLVGFAAVAASGGAAWGTLAFTAAILLVWTWLSMLSTHYHAK